MAIDFDPYARDFVQHYATVRGAVRLALLHGQVATHLPPASHVLDIGGGAGHLARELARDGHAVTVLDPSPTMLDEGRRLLSDTPTVVGGRVAFHLGAANDAGGVPGHGQFDAVLCHAVAPYVDDLGTLLDAVVQACAPDGLVSVVVKNRDALAVRPALEGRWTDALVALDADGDAGRLGVRNRAHRRDELVDALADRGCDVVAWYGVRVLSDAIIADEAPLDDVLALERSIAGRDPYRALGRLLHVVARRRRRPPVGPRRPDG